MEDAVAFIMLFILAASLFMMLIASVVVIAWVIGWAATWIANKFLKDQHSEWEEWDYNSRKTDETNNRSDQ